MKCIVHRTLAVSCIFIGALLAACSSETSPPDTSVPDASLDRTTSREDSPSPSDGTIHDSPDSPDGAHSDRADAGPDSPDGAHFDRADAGASNDATDAPSCTDDACDGGSPDAPPPDGDATVDPTGPLTTTPVRFGFLRSIPSNIDGSFSCAGLATVYEYAPTTRELVERRCESGAFKNRSGPLGQEAATRVENALLALRTTTVELCITDASQDWIELADDRGCALKTFADNHAAACVFPRAAPPYVDVGATNMFFQLLQSTMNAICSGPATTESGPTCRMTTDDAGTRPSCDAGVSP